MNAEPPHFWHAVSASVHYIGMELNRSVTGTLHCTNYWPTSPRQKSALSFALSRVVHQIGSSSRERWLIIMMPCHVTLPNHAGNYIIMWLDIKLLKFIDACISRYCKTERAGELLHARRAACACARGSFRWYVASTYPVFWKPIWWWVSDSILNSNKEFPYSPNVPVSAGQPE